jgi:hypothetical protein
MSGWSSAIEIEMQHLAQPRLVAVLSFIRAAAADFYAACNALLATLTTSLCALPYFTTFHLAAQHRLFWLRIALGLAAGDVIAVQNRDLKYVRHRRYSARAERS